MRWPPAPLPYQRSRRPLVGRVRAALAICPDQASYPVPWMMVVSALVYVARGYAVEWIVVASTDWLSGWQRVHVVHDNGRIHWHPVRCVFPAWMQSAWVAARLRYWTLRARLLAWLEEVDDDRK